MARLKKKSRAISREFGLEYLGIESKLGVDFLDKASIQGRDEKDVERAIERALEHGVSQSFIEKTGVRDKNKSQGRCRPSFERKCYE